jgi:hypothetical protein
MITGASALGIARPFFKHNTLNIDSNETVAVTFQLQNMESVEKRMIFKIYSQHTMQIEGGSFYEKQFILASGETRDVSIEFYAEDEGLYRVDYAYAETCASGQICFNTDVQDSFFIQVGDSTEYWGFDIPLEYTNYILNTESKDAGNVDDLYIVTKDGLIEVDFSGETIDLRQFQEIYVVFGTRSVTIDSASFPELNKQAIITMYQIENNYVIYKDGAKCSLTDCNVLSYGNKRLKFEVAGFSIYELKYESGGSGGTTSGGTSGGIPVNTTQAQPVIRNMTPAVPPETEPEQIPEQFPVTTPEKVDVNSIPNPFAKNTTVEKIGKNGTKSSILTQEGKNLLTRTTLLGAVSLVTAVGLLFYYRKYRGEEK